MINSQNDVIAAIATPIGEGGISVIRVSGEDAARFVDQRFAGRVALSTANTHTAHLGNIVTREREIVDQVVAIVYRGPHSYTGEDTVEICCHGGVYVTKKILEAILQAGARMAEPGEFTKRAFLNGKLDLVQAEAVADLIHSKTDFSYKTSLHQVQGKLSATINGLRENLIDVCSLLELELDFSEEGIELTSATRVRAKIYEVIAKAQELLSSYRYGKVSREGIHVVITGKPNVGKSSIINNLLQENRAIVTEIPGTTRDIIQENLNIDGVLFVISDTAGIRDSSDRIESEGISRTINQIGSADLILFVIDLSESIGDEDRQILRQIRSSNPDAAIVMVGNKCDIAQCKRPNLAKEFSVALDYVACSAMTGEGMDQLKDRMTQSVLGRDISAVEKNIAITDIRHKHVLEAALKHLENAIMDVESKKSNEFIALNLRLALDSLGEMIGVVTTDDLLSNIFKKFCIGK